MFILQRRKLKLRWFPQWLQRNKQQKWSWEKGCVSPQSSHSWHPCMTVLPSWSPSQTYRAHRYSLCMPLRQQHHPQSCLSHRPRTTCLALFPASHSSPLWELVRWPQPQSQLPHWISASFQLRAQTTASPWNSAPPPQLRQPGAVTGVLAPGLPSLRLSPYLWDEVWSPPKVRWNHLCTMPSAGLIPGAPIRLRLSRSRPAKKMNPPSPVALRELHLNLFIPGRLCTARSQAYLSSLASFPSPSCISQRGRVLPTPPPAPLTRQPWLRSQHACSCCHTSQQCFSPEFSGVMELICICAVQNGSQKSFQGAVEDLRWLVWLRNKHFN